jgi:dCTP deaminase
MILSRSQILKELNHSIFITPFSDEMLNSNSYNLSLSKHLIVYRDKELDMKKAYSSKDIVDLEIPDEGMILMPNILLI